MSDKCFTDAQLKMSLALVHPGLESIYDRCLDKISKCKNDLVNNLIFWVAFARRPLSEDEVREAISIDLAVDTLDQDSTVNNLSLLIDNCANLVILDESTRVIHLVHYTLKQFLIESPRFLEWVKVIAEDPYWSTLMPYGEVEANIRLGWLCMVYLSMTRFSIAVSYTHLTLPTIYSV